MKLSSLHFLLSYQCTSECDHCFVWGSPRQNGTMTLEEIKFALMQAKEIESIQSIFFEGGEPFLYYSVLLNGIKEAVQMGFSTGIVTNCFWANSKEDALANLKPFAGLIGSLSISTDLYHFNEKVSRQARFAQAAAEELGISLGMLSIARPDSKDAIRSEGQIPAGESAVMFRGRAVEKLAGNAVKTPWSLFNKCPHENFIEPGRIHLDCFGNLHICQGLIIGNIHFTPLKEICAAYNPEEHPITSALIEGGPARLVDLFNLPHADGYADACQLCYEARQTLRPRFPEWLAPDQMYGIIDG
jgi:hypothetical protein